MGDHTEVIVRIRTCEVMPRPGKHPRPEVMKSPRPRGRGGLPLVALGGTEEGSNERDYGLTVKSEGASEPMKE